MKTALLAWPMPLPATVLDALPDTARRAVMTKNGRAKELSNREFESVPAAIETHRHPARNAALVQASFELGLRVQELALLRLREVCRIDAAYPRG